MKRSFLNSILDVGRWTLGVFVCLSLAAAPQTVFVNPDGSIVNTTNFEFKLGKLQVCDALGNNCVAVDTALAAKQPLDTDLTAIAGVSTTAYGRNALAIVDAAAFRAYIGAGTSNFDGVFATLTSKPTTIAGYGITDFNSLGDVRWSLLAHTHTFASLTSKPTTIAGYGITDFNSLGDVRWQPLDSDLTTWAGLTPSANAQTLVTHTFAQMRTDLGLVIGTNVQAWDADLDTYATLPPSANAQTILGHTFAQMRTDLGLVIGTNVEAWDADLDTWAGITPAAGIGTFLATPTLVNLKAAVTDETTVGWNLLTLANPGAITFVQLNADNSVTAQSASAQRTALGLAIGTNVEAWDTDLDTYAANTPTTVGLNLVKLTNPGAISFIKIAADNSVSTRTAAQFIGDLDADLTTWAGITPGTGVGTALAINVGSAGAFVTNGGALGTPSSGTLTSATGLPISTGVSGLGTGVATFLATPTSANLAAALTDETGSGADVFGTSPTLVTPKIAKIVAPSDSITAIQLANAAGTAFVDLDSTNKRVGIGTNAPATFFHILDTNTNGALTEVQRMEVTDSGAGRTDYFKFQVGATSSRGGKIIFGETGSTFGESGIAFTLAQTTIYQDSTWPIVLQTNGQDRLTIAGPGAAGAGAVTVAGSLTGTILDSGTTTITNGLTLGHQSSGTPAAGFGEAILGNLNSSTTADQNAFRLGYAWQTATHASRASYAFAQTLGKAQALTDRQIIGASINVATNNTALSLFDLALPTLKGGAGTVTYKVFATDGTNVQVRSGIARYSAVNKAGVYTSEVAIANEAASVSSGTLTATVGFANGTNLVTFQITPNSSLTATTYYVEYTVQNLSEGAITVK